MSYAMVSLLQVETVGKLVLAVNIVEVVDLGVEVVDLTATRFPTICMHPTIHTHADK